MKKATKPANVEKLAENVEKLAENVAQKLGATKIPSKKGDGYKILVPNGKNDITVRIMKKAGQRSEPYYRVSLDKGGAVTKNGEFCSIQELTHSFMY